MNLCVSELRFAHNGRMILDGASFTVASGRMSVVLGPNGAGKTTLLRCLAGVYRPRGGSIRLDDQDVSRLSPRQRARLTGYVPQRVEAGRMTVFEAALLGRKPHIRFGASREDLRKVEAVLRRLGLDGLAGRRMDEISGGELQKTALARALVQEPRLLLLDEPTSSLDLKNQMDMLSLLRRVTDEHDVSVVMSLHDVNAALSFADEALFLKGGRVRSGGPVGAVTAEAISEVFELPVTLHRLGGRAVVVPGRSAGA